MKKVLSVFMILCMILTVCRAAVFAADADITIMLQIGNPNMTVNGAEKAIDEQGTAPVLINDRTLLPVRAVVEEMGGSVEWVEDTQTVILAYGSDTITLQIDNPTAYLNDEAKTLDTAPMIIGDRTMMPIRFIAESFGFNVGWDDATQTATVSKAEDSSSSSAATATPAPEAGGKTLVAYFSCTNNTAGIAKHIIDGIGADAYEIVPEVPFTEADLDYNSDCRANREQNDDTARPAINGSIENMAQYDTIFLGYPIWWGNAPKIIFTFLESYDFAGKTIIPFCTSGSSPIGSTAAMQSVTPGANWLDGHRFSGGSSSDVVMEWVNGLGL